MARRGFKAGKARQSCSRASPRTAIPAPADAARRADDAGPLITVRGGGFSRPLAGLPVCGRRGGQQHKGIFGARHAVDLDVTIDQGVRNGRANGVMIIDQQNTHDALHKRCTSPDTISFPNICPFILHQLDGRSCCLIQKSSGDADDWLIRSCSCIIPRSG
jgi:hypothetical protein